MTTAVCPLCGYKNRVAAEVLTPRYEIPCQAPRCGTVFTPLSSPDDYDHQRIAMQFMTTGAPRGREED